VFVEWNKLGCSMTADGYDCEEAIFEGAGGLRQRDVRVVEFDHTNDLDAQCLVDLESASDDSDQLQTGGVLVQQSSRLPRPCRPS
jgi:hypothetical protein